MALMNINDHECEVHLIVQLLWYDAFFQMVFTVTYSSHSRDGAPGARGGGGFVGPMILRLAWHCAGTYCVKAQNGGSDGGTMRFKPESDHGGNAGLGFARDLLEPIKKKHPEVTYADLYILAGVVAVEEMGGPKVPFRYGRSDAPAARDPKDDARFSPDGRLPDGDKHAAHLRDIFFR